MLGAVRLGFHQGRQTIAEKDERIDPSLFRKHPAPSRRRSPDHQLIEEPHRTNRNLETDRTDPCLRMVRLPHTLKAVEPQGKITPRTIRSLWRASRKTSSSSSPSPNLELV